MRDVVLICGPPCAGKTTLAHRLADDHEIVDFDAIAVDCAVHGDWIAATEAEVQARITRIAADPEARAIVIRTAPRGPDRERIAAQLDARCILLMPDERTCRTRAAVRLSGTRKAIGIWYWRYTASHIDQMLTTASAHTFGTTVVCDNKPRGS